MTEITQADENRAVCFISENDGDFTELARLFARHREAAVAEALNAAKVSDPDMPGDYVGDVWFGHPEKRTLGTHRWDGAKWVELPSELDATLALLADARTQLTTLRAKLAEAIAHYDVEPENWMRAVEAIEGLRAFLSGEAG